MDIKIGTMFVIVFLTYYSIYFISLLNKKNRMATKFVNENLDKMREKKIKTIEEQKAFLNLKYPKKIKQKFSWKSVPFILWGIIKFMLVLYLYTITFNYFKININLWWAIVFIIIAPLLINILLERFKLNKQDLRVFFR